MQSALAGLTSPGRLEVVGRHPLVIVDGTKNEAGAVAVRRALDEEWAAVAPRVLVVGMLQGKGKDPTRILEALGARSAALVIGVPGAVAPHDAPLRKSSLRRASTRRRCRSGSRSLTPRSNSPSRPRVPTDSCW